MDSLLKQQIALLHKHAAQATWSVSGIKHPISIEINNSLKILREGHATKSHIDLSPEFYLQLCIHAVRIAG